MSPSPSEALATSLSVSFLTSSLGRKGRKPPLLSVLLSQARTGTSSLSLLAAAHFTGEGKGELPRGPQPGGVLVTTSLSHEDSLLAGLSLTLHTIRHTCLSHDDTGDGWGQGFGPKLFPAYRPQRIRLVHAGSQRCATNRRGVFPT